MEKGLSADLHMVFPHVRREHIFGIQAAKPLYVHFLEQPVYFRGIVRVDCGDFSVFALFISLQTVHTDRGAPDWCNDFLSNHGIALLLS
jgi:hypothetical protein